MADTQNSGPAVAPQAPPASPGSKPYRKRGGIGAGVLLIALGLVFLIVQFIPGASIAQLWPLFVILVGAVPSTALDDARARETPLVFVNRPDPGDAGSAYIGIDNRRAGADVAALLLHWGVRSAA